MFLRTSFFLSAILLLCGCSKPKNPLLGTWKIEPSSLAGIYKVAPNQEAAQGIIKKLSDWTLVFEQGGKVTTSANGSKEFGTYSQKDKTVSMVGFKGPHGEVSNLNGTLGADGKTLTTTGGVVEMKFVKAD